jgi:Nucleotidyl transferase AbiEii toxin, Type IV TA system
VVEKDYVLGWILAGIYGHEELAESWVFKGGTCLKKCYFETYRFSEDLDFTLREEEDPMKNSYEPPLRKSSRAWRNSLASPPTSSNSISTTTLADAPIARAKSDTEGQCRRLRVVGQSNST